MQSPIPISVSKLVEQARKMQTDEVWICRCGKTKLDNALCDGSHKQRKIEDDETVA